MTKFAKNSAVKKNRLKMEILRYVMQVLKIKANLKRGRV
jgi:hypothetical protein